MSDWADYCGVGNKTQRPKTDWFNKRSRFNLRLY